jgi:hypothetical protein
MMKGRREVVVGTTKGDLDRPAPPALPALLAPLFPAPVGIQASAVAAGTHAWLVSFVVLG